MGDGILPLPLQEVFTAAGITAWGAVVVLVVQFLKRLSWFPVPETGRGVLYAVATVSLLIVIAAVWDAQLGLTSAEQLIGYVLTWIALSTAAVGVFEAGAKAVRVARKSTNPSGPDTQPGAVI